MVANEHERSDEGRRGGTSYASVTLCALAVSLLFARLVARTIGKTMRAPVLHLAGADRRARSLRAGGSGQDAAGMRASADEPRLDGIEARAEEVRGSGGSFRELADAMPHMVWSMRADGATSCVNRQLLEYLDLAPEDANMWRWGVGLHPDDREACLAGWNEALRAEIAYQTECRIRRAADGSYRWHLARAVPVRGHDGRITHWCGTCTDIHGLKQAQNEARELNALLEKRVEEGAGQLAAANRELEAFSYSVSHDLRAPLRAIDGFSRILQEDYDDKLDDEGRRLLAVVRDSSQELGRLIDGLLAFSRLGRSEIVGADVDMTALVRTLLEAMRREPGGLPEVDLQPLPRARCDPSLMREVWSNLVSNAVKFSAKAREPRIEIGGRREGQTNVYCVRDNGAGFDMRYAGKLFGVFQRLHRAQEYPGTGVGLAIVQRLVSKHGGKVWAQGVPGEGATFYFTLPANGAAHCAEDSTVGSAP